MIILKQLVANFLDYLWPRFCLGCKQEGSFCCNQCKNNIRLLPLDYQAWVETKNFAFDHCYVCLNYSDKLTQNLIKSFKYNYLKNLQTILADILTAQIKKLNLEQAIITNVPLHYKKKRKRGFDQTEILAKQVAKNLNYEYLKLIKRVKNTSPQAELSKLEREDNVKDAFKLDQAHKITGKTIILIDDVVTTGSTLHEAASKIKTANPSKVLAVVLAKN